MEGGRETEGGNGGSEAERGRGKGRDQEDKEEVDEKEDEEEEEELVRELQKPSSGRVPPGLTLVPLSPSSRRALLANVSGTPSRLSRLLLPELAPGCFHQSYPHMSLSDIHRRRLHQDFRQVPSFATISKAPTTH